MQVENDKDLPQQQEQYEEEKIEEIPLDNGGGSEEAEEEEEEEESEQQGISFEIKSNEHYKVPGGNGYGEKDQRRKRK